MQKENTTLARKVALRRQLLDGFDSPIVMETHGGYGKVYKDCYADIEDGVVFEKRPEKAEVLARQRPTWSVYQSDCIKAISAGAGAHLDVSFLDVDPHGEAWPVLDAFFGSERPWPKELRIVVNDGLRARAKIGSIADVESMADVLPVFGPKIHDNYLEVCQWLLEKKASQRGYTLALWNGYYCGHASLMTHFGAVLRK